MIRNLNFYPAAALLLLLGWLPLQSLAACQEKITELDQRIDGSELDPNLRNSVAMFRDQAASTCDQGHDASAMQLLGMIEMMLPPPQAEVDAARQADADSLKPLTDAFMVGRWCAMTGEERAELDFAADGTYQPCFPNSMINDYACSAADARQTAEWVAQHQSALRIEQDTIVFADRRGRPGMTYQRGRCRQLGR
jgi:hypothetical protein